MIPTVRFQFALVAACCVSPAANAQQPTSTPPTKTSEPVPTVEIIGTAVSYDPRREDTASKIVLDHNEIIKYGDTNVFDVLRRVPGITIGGAAGRGMEIRMRGLGNGYTQILVNGERVSAGFSIESLTPDSIELIEVMRAATAEFSTQSIAGTVNIVLRKVVKTISQEMKISAAAGDGGGLSPRVIYQASDRKDRLSYSVISNVYRNNFARRSHIEEEGIDQQGKTTLRRDSVFVDKGHTDSLSISPKIHWAFSDGDSLTSQSNLNLNSYARTSHLDVGTSVGAPPAYPLVDDRIEWGNQFFRTELNWIAKLAQDSKIDVKLGGVYGKLQHDLWQQGYLVKSQGPIFNDLVSGRGTERGYTFSGKYHRQIDKGHRLAIGWDTGHSDKDESKFERVLLGTTQSAYADTTEQFTASVNRLAFFAQDDWTVLPRWSVYLGVRWEGISTSVSGTGFDASDSSTSIWSPLFQTLYKFPNSKKDQVRLAVTKTYKAPSTNNLIPRRFASANNSSTELDFQGNPDLRPELAVGFDAAYEHYWAESALTSISISSRNIHDYIRHFTYQSDNGRWISQPINDGNAKTFGLELETKFTLNSLLTGAPAVDIRGSISRNWSEVENAPGPNNRVDQQTPLSANFGADYKTGQITVGGSFAFQNGGPVRQSITQSTYSSARRNLEAYVMWKLGAQHLFRIYASNILGQKDFNDRKYQDDMGTLRRTGIYPNRPAVRITLEKKL